MLCLIVIDTDLFAAGELRLIMTPKFLRLMGVSLVLSLAINAGVTNTLQAAPIAKKLFGAKKLPAVLKPAAFGFYSKGCIAGAVAIANDGPTWQAMRPARNRRWGHPELIKLVIKLSQKAQQGGWNGILVGDISQPRGGPMLSGHASHQMGLDADIWLNEMPKRRYSTRERNNVSAVSMLKDRYSVSEKIWTKGHFNLIKSAARFEQVERVLVHPGIKKKLCDTATGDRSWLQKVRPYWGHHYHMHVRMGCPAGSAGCRKQAATVPGDGCGKNLKWWFDVGLAPPKKIKRPKGWKPPKVKPKRQIRLGDLPQACAVVLNASAPVSAAAATIQLKNGKAFAPRLVASKASVAASAIVQSNQRKSTLPTFRSRP